MVMTRSEAKKTVLNQRPTRRSRQEKKLVISKAGVITRSRAKMNIQRTVDGFEQNGTQRKNEAAMYNLLRHNTIFRTMVASQMCHPTLLRLRTTSHAMMKMANCYISFEEKLNEEIKQHNCRTYHLNHFIDLSNDGKDYDKTEMAIVVAQVESEMYHLQGESQIILEYVSREDNVGHVPEFEVFREDEQWIRILQAMNNGFARRREILCYMKAYFKI